MIPRAAEVLEAIYGALLLARLEARGMVFFDRSVEGFWKSFFAAVLVAPFYLILLLLGFAHEAPEASPPQVVLVEAVAYVISWTAFPVVMYEVTRAIDKDAQYTGYIVAFNWAQVVQMAVLVPFGILQTLGLLPTTLATFLGLIVNFAVLGYEWFIARTALGLTGAGALGVVALAFALMLTIRAVAHGMVG